MKHASYFSHLKFDKKLTQSLQAKYLGNPRLLILLLLMIVSFGLFSYFNLPRRLFPEIKIPLVIVSTVFPGAGPSEVESLITDPLEDSLGSVENIKTFTSTSRDSVSIIQVEFNSGTDADSAETDVKSVIDKVNLPDDALDPSVLKIDFEQFPVWSFSLISKENDTASLIEFSKRLKDRLEGISTVDSVSISGLEEQEIQITIKPETLSTYAFNPQVLISAVSNATKSLPAGTVRTESSSFTLSVNPLISSIDDIRNIKVNLNGSVITLSDIANVGYRSKPNQLQSFIGQKDLPVKTAVSFSIYKTQNADISKTVDLARKDLDLVFKQYDHQFTIFTTSDVSEQIDRQFNELIRDFIITIFLVFTALLIFLGIRQAVVASLSIPLTFLISFTIMNVFDVSLSFISFFSLLLALGLVVDDTIVVISAMTAYHRSKKFTPFQTGLLVWRDFITPIFTTTLTTVWAFVPLLLSTGIIGEFIKPIPIVVSTTLLASFLVAMFITLPIVTFLFKPTLPKRVAAFLIIVFLILIFSFVLVISPKNLLLVPILLVLGFLLFVTYKVRESLVDKINSKNSFKKTNVKYYLTHGIISFEGLSIRYQLFIRKILASKRWIRITVTLVIIFSIFSYLLVPFGLVKNEFFPREDADQISISVELPSGTNLTVGKKEALEILEKLRVFENVQTASVNLGQASGDFGGASASSNNFLYTLVLDEERTKDSSQIIKELRAEFKDYTKGKLSVIEQSGGPPAGSDVQIKILGPELLVLDGYADNIIAYLNSKPGTANVDKSIKPGTSKIAFVANRQKLSENNVSADQIGFTLRTFASGFELDSVKLDPSSNEQQDITLRFASNEQFVESIGSLLIGTPQGSIPLLSLGNLELKSSPTLITREDGSRTISVSASVEAGYAIADINKDLEAYANSLSLPSGYSWKTGGVNEQNQESITSVLIAMVLSVILILITMVLQFSSFRKAFIVILVIPLSISGVFIIFGLTNTYLSFPALVGVLALFGIVVKNSILIVDKIQANQKTKMSFEEAIAEGAASRLEPIALTSLTAILGLLPITVSDPLWRGLGGAIIAGLTFSGTIMLFFIPVVYYLIFRSSAKKRG